MKMIRFLKSDCNQLDPIEMTLKYTNLNVQFFTAQITTALTVDCLLHVIQ